MSRRDTILIAALINAGLLVILFISALKNQQTSKEVVGNIDSLSPSASAEVLNARKEAAIIMGDEVDQVLSHYTKLNPLQSDVEISPVQKSQEALSFPIVEEKKPGIISLSSNASEDNLKQPLFIEIKVKKGDVLEKLAKQYQTTISEIMKINQLTSSALKIGQTLKIPEKTETKKAKDLLSSDLSIQYYTVKSGDSPWTIAVKNHLKVEDFLKLNHMDEEKARKLKPGDQIRIR